MMLVGCVVLCSCSEADKVNRNISKQANYFEAERRITVYNARTDNVILEMEGAMSISNNDNNELVCTAVIINIHHRVGFLQVDTLNFS